MLGVDASPKVVQACAVDLTHVVQADATDVEALRQLGAADFGRAAVTIGTDIQASILATYALVDLGVPRIWAKAVTAEHGAILSASGRLGSSSPSSTWASGWPTRWSAARSTTSSSTRTSS